MLPPGVRQEKGHIRLAGGAPALIMQNPGDCFDHLFTVRHTFRETFRDTGCVPRKREEAAMRRRLPMVQVSAASTGLVVSSISLP